MHPSFSVFFFFFFFYAIMFTNSFSKSTPSLTNILQVTVIQREIKFNNKTNNLNCVDIQMVKY